MSSGVVPVIEMPTVGRLLRADRLAALVIAAALASLFGCATSTSLPPRPSAPGSGDPAASGRPSAGSADTGGPSTATPGASATIGDDAGQRTRARLGAGFKKFRGHRLNLRASPTNPVGKNSVTAMKSAPST